MRKMEKAKKVMKGKANNSIGHRWQKQNTDLFQKVKAAVSTRQAAEHYDIKVSRSGMACCPFHDDHNPSLKLDERYFCFGCQATGDVIDFAAAYLQLSPLEAAKQLAADFNIPYDTQEKGNSPMSSTEQFLGMKVIQERRAFLDWKRKTLSELAGFFRILEDCKERYAPKARDDPWSPLFVQSCNDQVLVNLYTYLLENASEDDQHALYLERKTTIDPLAKRITDLPLPSESNRQPFRQSKAISL